ncbi:MAG: hydroxymethylbilane synthase [Chloroflexi bacterium]|jgi:hydroxymethylbilane synthase|nr:hydroxymethylbilane synthase [Chloroflexota bacterium]
MTEHLRIGSRGSKLAVIQAEYVRDQLVSLNPGVEFEMVTVTTTGDQNTTVSLEKLGGEGVFVKELEEALLKKQIDIAVHSLKDMLTTIPENLRLAAVPQRVDPRDVIISPAEKLAELPAGAKIGTGSQRRAVQIRALRSDIEICGLRGNIDTRIRKAFSDELDGIVMAAAALIRLGMEDRISEYLSTEDFIPAVGQGALGIEIRANDARTYEIVAPLDHQPSCQCVTAERSFLRALGGGCRAPIAALGIVEDEKLSLNGIVSDPQGNTILHASIEGSASEPERVGRELAAKMIDMGAESLVEKGQ